MKFRFAVSDDCALLARLNRELIQDEGHRNAMDEAQLEILRSQNWAKDKRLTVEVLTRNEPALRFWRAMNYQDYSLALEILPNGAPR